MELIYRDRRGTDCCKWDHLELTYPKAEHPEELLPMWVADMDFEVAPCVKEALLKEVDFGVFGYPAPSDSYYNSIISWETRRHGYDIKREWIRYSSGVVAAFNWFIQCLTAEGDAVLIQPPVYYPFKNAVVNNNRKLVENKLVRTATSYEIDFDDFEKKIAEENVKMFILCSPHNPAGRIWTADELKHMLDICKSHNVYVISDEIHQDLVMPGNKKITAATLGDYDDILVTLCAPSKTFNLAGFKNSVVIIPSEKIREVYDKYTEQIRGQEGVSLGYVAAEAAFNGGEEWLDAIINTIYGNYKIVKEMLEEALPKVWIPELQATYLMWVDLREYVKPEDIEDVILNKAKIAVDFGSWFGAEDDSGSCIRLNLATCRENVEEACNRLIKALG